MSEIDNKELNIVESRQKIFLYVLVFALSGLLPALFSFLYQKETDEILRNTITGFIGGGAIVFLYRDAVISGTLQYDNRMHGRRFFMFYLICLVAAVAFPLISFAIWPYVVIFVILGLYSNFQTGLFSGTFLVCLSVLLEQKGEYGEVLLYVMAGAIALSLLQNLTEDMQIGLPLFVIEAVLFLLLLTYFVLFLNASLSFSMFVLPLLNLLFTGVLLALFIQMFSVGVIRKSKDRYMEINDTEFPLMSMLKEKNKNEFFRGVHTAFFAERAASELHLDPRPVKTCAYYARIGIMDGAVTEENTMKYCREFDFPEDALGLIHEYYHQNGTSVSKELSILLICETVVSSTLFLFQKDKEAKLNIDSLVDKVIEKKLDNGQLEKSELTFRELQQIKDLLKRERLYYDFLR